MIGITECEGRQVVSMLGYCRGAKGSETCQERKHSNSRSDLGTETVEGSAGPFQCVDNIESGDGLAFGVLSVGDRVTDNLMRPKEKLERVQGDGGHV